MNARREASTLDEARRARQRARRTSIGAETSPGRTRTSRPCRRREAEARDGALDAADDGSRGQSRRRADLEELACHSEDARDADGEDAQLTPTSCSVQDDRRRRRRPGQPCPAFRSAIATMRKALGEKDALSIWHEIYKKNSSGGTALQGDDGAVGLPLLPGQDVRTDVYAGRSAVLRPRRGDNAAERGKSSEKGKRLALTTGISRATGFKLQHVRRLRSGLFDTSEARSARARCRMSAPAQTRRPAPCTRRTSRASGVKVERSSTGGRSRTRWRRRSWKRTAERRAVADSCSAPWCGARSRRPRSSKELHHGRYNARHRQVDSERRGSSSTRWLPPSRTLCYNSAEDRAAASTRRFWRCPGATSRPSAF